MSKFLDHVEKRRTAYVIGKNIKVKPEEIVKTVERAVIHTPSSFNSQSSRTVILFGDNHDLFWNLVKETLRKVVPKDMFKSTEEKMESFRSGAGTILFFEDMNVVKKLQNTYPTYKDNIPVWSLQGNGMLEFVVWTALKEMGLGASLQHYNPIIDDEVKKKWDLPNDWKLLAQMPFGEPLAEPRKKDFLSIEERVFVFM